jgi:hypothetical protein
VHDFIKLAAIGGAALTACIRAWLHAYYGRKVRLKVGDIEAEAQSVEEVEKLLKLVEQSQATATEPPVREPPGARSGHWDKGPDQP